MKKHVILLLSLLLFAILLCSLSSCGGGSSSDGEDDISDKLDSILEKSNFVSSIYNYDEMKDLYIRYFRIYPEEFESFCNDRDGEIEKYGRCYVSTPKIKFDIVMPDGSYREYTYDMYSGEVRCWTMYENNFNGYDYRYTEIEGYYTEKQDGAKIFDKDMNNVAAVSIESLANTTLYARMAPAEVKVELDLGGAESIDGITEFNIKIGDDLASYLAFTPEKSGHIFIGWSYDSVGTPELITPDMPSSGEPIPLDTEKFVLKNALDGKNKYADGEYKGKYHKEYSVKISAVYTPIMHKITCLGPDGETYSEVEYAYGTTIYQHTLPTISFYDYKGWSLSAGSDVLFDRFSIEGDVTLYPVEAEKKHVTLYIGDYLVIEAEASDAYPFILSAIVPTGYKFAGWYLDAGYTVKVEKTTLSFDEVAYTYYMKLEKTEVNNGE